MNHRSLAFRLSVWYALLLSATFAAVGVAMFYGLGQYLRSSLRDPLQRRSVQIEQILTQSSERAPDSLIADAINTRIAPEFNNRYVRVMRAPAQMVYQSGLPADRSFDPVSIPPPSAQWPDTPAFRAERTARGTLLIRAAAIDTPSGRYLIELGAGLAPVEAVEHRLLSLLGVLLPILLGCAVGGGYLLVQWALRPVDRISQTAERISVQDLEARLPVLPSGDALQRLSLSLNHMLTRLRDSMQSSRRFLADASHELRTPLTVIKGELQQIVASPECPLDLRERIGSVLEEVGRLEHLVLGLLALSRLDAGDAQREWVEVDLGRLASGIVEQMRLVAEDRGVQLESSVEPEICVRGDRGRLKQVIVNLIDNAIKFTPREGRVYLSVVRHNDRAQLEVRDTGIGIPESAQPYLFDRFYRVDEARTREDGGAGLGLSIVRSICSAHAIDIEVRSIPGSGTGVILSFPQHSPALTPTASVARDAESPGVDDVDTTPHAKHRTGLCPWPKH